MIFWKKNVLILKCYYNFYIKINVMREKKFTIKKINYTSKINI